MVNVILNPNPIPEDAEAIYVWPDVVQPAWGAVGAFGQRPRVGVTFSDADWQAAIDGAKAAAQKANLATVYVVRDA